MARYALLCALVLLTSAEDGSGEAGSGEAGSGETGSVEDGDSGNSTLFPTERLQEYYNLLCSRCESATHHRRISYAEEEDGPYVHDIDARTGLPFVPMTDECFDLIHTACEYDLRANPMVDARGFQRIMDSFPFCRGHTATTKLEMSEGAYLRISNWRHHNCNQTHFIGTMPTISTPVSLPDPHLGPRP